MIISPSCHIQCYNVAQNLEIKYNGNSLASSKHPPLLLKSFKKRKGHKRSILNMQFLFSTRKKNQIKWDFVLPWKFSLHIIGNFVVYSVENTCQKMRFSFNPSMNGFFWIFRWKKFSTLWFYVKCLTPLWKLCGLNILWFFV